MKFYFINEILEHWRRFDETKYAEHLKISELRIVKVGYETERVAHGQYELKFVDGSFQIALEANAEHFE